MKHTFMLAKLKKILLACCLAASVISCDNANTQLLSERSLIYCSEGSPETLNPQLITSGVTADATSKQLYNQLIVFDPKDNSIAPSIAKSWHITQDNKKITFYLRKNVAFHTTDYFTPTRTLNADDILFSFNRILKSDNLFHHVSGGKYPYFQSVGFSELIEDIERINDYTVRFTLRRADSSFMANLANDFAVILSKEYAQSLVSKNALAQIDTFPIGTGPFKFKEYRTGAYIRYQPHEDYWGDKSQLSQLIYDISPSNSSRLTKLLAGECDVISYPIAHQKITENPNLQLESVTALNIGYLGFNTAKPPFDNKLVRLAVAHAIDTKAILNTVYFGDAEAEPAHSILPPSSWAYESSIESPQYDVDKAVELLKEANISGPIKIDLWAMPVQRSYNPDAVTMAKLIQEDLKKLNIEVNIVTYNWQEFLRRLSLGEHNAVLLGWSADHPDPDNFLTPLLSCASAEIGNNRTFWCNNQFDSLLKQALDTANVEMRKQLYQEAQKIAAAEVPLFPIAHSKRFQARTKNIKGPILSSFGGISFGEVTKE